MPSNRSAFLYLKTSLCCRLRLIIIISNSYIALFIHDVSKRFTSACILLCIMYILPIVPSTLTNLYLQFFLSLFFLTIYPNPPCQLPCGRKPENPEKTHDFQQSVDQLLPRACMIKCSNTGFELLTSEVGGSRSDDKATEAPISS